jgi:putative hydrolase of the HAD superfamily
VPLYVIFDLFATLVSGASGERNQVVAEMAGVLGVDPPVLVRAYRQTWPQRMTMWGVEETVRTIAARLGASPTDQQIREAAALRRAFARRILLSASGTTYEVLDSLRAAGYRLGLISNATADTSEAWPSSPLAARFDAAVFSCDFGAAKPDPSIYLAVTGALGAKASECAYVGDGADRELAGAAALGMDVIRTTEFSDSDPAWPGKTVSSLSALPGLMPASPAV